MLLEFFAAGLVVAFGLLIIGYFSEKRHFVLGGAIVLIMVGMFLAMDGLEVVSGEALTYANITGFESNAPANLTVLNQTTTLYQTMAFGYSEAISLMLMLGGLGAILVWGMREE